MQRRVVTEESIERKFAEGWGRGCRESYAPYVPVKRGGLSSRGVSSIVPNPVLGRAHHVLSNGELALLMRLLFKQPWDIREQCPLERYPGDHPLIQAGPSVSPSEMVRLPFNAGTIQIAGQMGIRHPHDQKSKVPFVLTTDFLVTKVIMAGGPRLSAYSYKPGRRLEGKRMRRVLELLELERRYWTRLGVDWRLVTDADLSQEVTMSLLWLYSFAVLPDPLPALVPAFLARAADVDWISRPVRECLSRVAFGLGCNQSEAVALFRHALWHRLLSADLSSRIHLRDPLPSVRVQTITAPGI